MKQILIVEDEKFISELYLRALSKAGYNPTVAGDGDKGLELALTGKYDIVLLDIMVPGTLGVDVLKIIKNDYPEIKSQIIITTNLEQDEVTRAEVERLADAYIIKAEVTPKELVGYIDKIEINNSNE